MVAEGPSEPVHGRGQGKWQGRGQGRGSLRRDINFYAGAASTESEDNRRPLWPAPSAAALLEAVLTKALRCTLSLMDRISVSPDLLASRARDPPVTSGDHVPRLTFLVFSWKNREGHSAAYGRSQSEEEEDLPQRVSIRSYFVSHHLHGYLAGTYR